ncbi:MAG: LOG family protein [Spirochaetia bacterium]|nr:LOG family protein [Spirochaetia bacterium]
MKNKKRKKERKETVKSFLDEDFLISPDARPIRILSEYLHPRKVFREHAVDDTIVFFGSARAPSPRKLHRIISKSKGKTLSDEEKKILEKQKIMCRYYREATQLSYKLTTWSKTLPPGSRRFLIATGGGPGIMEAANRGASLARGISVGLNITLPHEQNPNPYITPGLNFDFHYFFMRKLWFMYLAKALVIFPGGFGTCDELFELLTLVQTGKLTKPRLIVIYGKEFWKSVINFDVFIEWGAINKKDLEYVHFSDSVDDAFKYLVEHLEKFYINKPKAKDIPTELP